MLQAWMEANGREPAGASWEIYWNDPAQVADPAELRTEVVFPVKAKG